MPVCLWRGTSIVHLASRQLNGKRCGGTVNGCCGDTGACFKPQICFNVQWPILERLMAISGMSVVANTPV